MLKHSRARSARITLATPDRLTLVVEYDGVGLDGRRPGGVGLDARRPGGSGSPLCGSAQQNSEATASSVNGLVAGPVLTRGRLVIGVTQRPASLTWLST